MSQLAGTVKAVWKSADGASWAIGRSPPSTKSCREGRFTFPGLTSNSMLLITTIGSCLRHSAMSMI
jgi:hypothetical protein